MQTQHHQDLLNTTVLTPASKPEPGIEYRLEKIYTLCGEDFSALSDDAARAVVFEDRCGLPPTATNQERQDRFLSLGFKRIVRAATGMEIYAPAVLQ